MSSIIPVRLVNDEWDVGYGRALAGQAYGGANVVGAVAAQFSHSQLWNPSTTRTLIVTGISAGTITAATAINIYRAGAAILNLSMVPASKLCNGATAPASLAQIRAENNAAVLPAAADLLFSGLCLASTMLPDWLDGGPLVIQPGFGVTVVNMTVNQTLQVSYDFYERGV